VAKKYEFIGEEKYFYRCTVRRIRAVRDFGNVKKGELGGWIESEKNLSHEGLCWVGDRAFVTDNAEVREDAVVSGNAQIRANAVVGGNAEVSGYAQVEGNAIVCERGKVGGYALIYGNAGIRGRSAVWGNALVCGDVVMCEKANVYGHAIVCGNVVIDVDANVRRQALIRSSEDIFTVSRVGNKNERITAYRTKNGDVDVIQGNFGGTLEEFTKVVHQEHGDSNIEKEYRALIKFLQVRFSA